MDDKNKKEAELLDELNESKEEIKLQEKANKIVEEKQELLTRVLSGNLHTKHDQVGFVLNNYSKARNSDIELAWKYWEVFESDNFNGRYVTKENLKILTKINSLTRSRARIQNEYKLFQADNEVRKHRGVLSDEQKNEAIEQKPKDIPNYSIFIDETGKTQDYLSVGSLWVFDGFQSYKSSIEIYEWRKREGIDYEFHFAEVKGHKLDSFKEFFLKFLNLNPTISFKTIIINRKGNKQLNQTITDLTFHLINKGVQHEDLTGRAPLPRLLQVWLDEEESGSDQLKIENLKERLSAQKNEKLYLGDFAAVDSKANFNIQAVDLFTAAVNRRLHNPNSSNVKDELADYILKLLNFDTNSVNISETDTDRSKVFNLTYKE